MWSENAGARPAGHAEFWPLRSSWILRCGVLQLGAPFRKVPGVQLPRHTRVPSVPKWAERVALLAKAMELFMAAVVLQL